MHQKKQIDLNARYAVYVRVSDDDQHLENQEQELREFISEYNLKITRWYREDGESGRIPFAERPAGKELMADALRHKFDHVLTWDVGRLGRNFVDSIHIVDQWKEELDVGFLSQTTDFDTATHEGRLIFMLYAWMADKERDDIMRRTRTGIDRVAREGRWPGGPPPYGYKINSDGFLEECPIEAMIVRRIFDWYGGGKTSVQIAALLTAQGVPTPMVSRARNTKKPYSNRWLPSNIGKILHGLYYLGEFWFRKYRVERKKGRIVGYTPTNREDQTLLVIPALITPEQFARVIKRRESGDRRPSVQASRDYLLRGLVKCGCGRACIGSVRTSRHGKRIPCYGCITKKDPTGSCSSPRVRAEVLEQRVKEEIRLWLSNPGSVLLKLRERLETASQPDESFTTELLALQQSIQEKTNQVNETAKLISTQPHLAHIFLPQLEERNRELRAFMDHQEDLQDRALDVVDVDAAIHAMTDLIRELNGALAEIEDDPGTWRTIIRALVARIILTGEDQGGRFLIPKIQLVVRYPQAQNGCVRSCSSPSRLEQAWTHSLGLESDLPRHCERADNLR